MAVVTVVRWGPRRDWRGGRQRLRGSPTRQQWQAVRRRTVRLCLGAV